LDSHGITVEKAYKNFTGSPYVKIAKNLLIGTLMNLIDNSIYWLDQKNKKIGMSSDIQKLIYLDLQEEEKFINLIFADNGTGFLIPTEDISEPFVSAKPGGMGLGLHIANEIM